MGWVDALRGQVVALDTAPVIYYVQKDPLYVDMLHPFFQLVDQGECFVVTSVMTLLEALVVPIRRANIELSQQFRDFLYDSKGIITIELFPHIAEEAARLRAFYTIRNHSYT